MYAFVSVVGEKDLALYALVAEGASSLEQRRYRIPEVKMIPSNLNRCRFKILENNKQTRESTALSVAYYGITLSVGVGVGRGSWDVVGASQRGRIRTATPV